MADNYTALKSSQKKRYISKETFNSLDLLQIPVGSEYEVINPIEKGDLSADINNALNKAENALPKPTNDTTGSAGQVLKKTANGSEWGDAPSGGGKLYMHDVTMINKSGVKLPIVKFKYISTDNTEFSVDKVNFNICFDIYATDTNVPPKYYQVKNIMKNPDENQVSIEYYTGYPFSVTASDSINILIADMDITDKVIEL